MFTTKIEFKAFGVWYSIAFNGRSVLEVYGKSEDIKQFCEYFCLSEKNDHSEKTKRICVIHNCLTGDEISERQLELSFYDEKIFDKFDTFVIENAKDFVTNEILQIIKNHPDHYWLLCRENMPDYICSDNVCVLETDEDRSHFWNVFVPYETTLYNDLKFGADDKNYRINMGSHNAVLIQGNTCTGKTMMCDTLNTLTAHVQAWMEWNGDLKGFLVGNDEPRFAKVCVLGLNDLFFINDFFTIDSIFDKYKIFVIDHADILVNSKIEKVIIDHPEHNWVLIGNYRPDFIPEDAVCVWKKEGCRYWNEFVSEFK